MADTLLRTIDTHDSLGLDEQEIAGQSSSAVRMDEIVRITSDVYLRALLKGNRQEALAAIQEGLRQGLRAADIYLKIFQPAMYEVGRRWERNGISVAEEHIATAITQYVMAHCYPHLFQADQSKKKGTLAMTGVAGELHEIGLRMVSDFLEAQNWDVVYFGTNMPPSTVVQKLVANPPMAVGVSVTMAFNVPAAEGFIQAIRLTPALQVCKVIVGGAAFRFDESLGQALQADGWGRDAQEAIQTLDTLCTK